MKRCPGLVAEVLTAVKTQQCGESSVPRAVAAGAHASVGMRLVASGSMPGHTPPTAGLAHGNPGSRCSQAADLAYRRGFVRGDAEPSRLGSVGCLIRAITCASDRCVRASLLQGPRTVQHGAAVSGSPSEPLLA